MTKQVYTIKLWYAYAILQFTKWPIKNRSAKIDSITYYNRNMELHNIRKKISSTAGKLDLDLDLRVLTQINLEKFRWFLIGIVYLIIYLSC